MKEVISALAQLQTIDNEIYKYALQKDKLANTLNELKDLVARMEQSVEDKKTKLSDVQRWYDEQKEILSEYNERMNRIKASLNAVTKTKDYLTRQKELENLRRHKQAKEDEIKKVEETINDFRDAIDRDLARIEELKLDTEAEGGATWDQVHELEATIANIATQREHLLPEVPKGVQRRYDQIKARREGVAIVEVLTDGCCGGCHVQLRAQQFNILLRMESLEACPRCNRFMYVSSASIEELKQQQAVEE